MWTDEHVKQQLADYSAWLEDHLGSDLRPSPAAAVRGHRRRKRSALLAVVGAGSVIALIAVTLSAESHNAVTVVPVVPASTVHDSSTTVMPVSPSGPATTWAPLNLPDGMRVVDVSWGSELPGYIAPLAAQRFARLSVDGASQDATLWLKVKKTDERPYESSTYEVHGIPISAVQSDPLQNGVPYVTGSWVEQDLWVEFATTGLALPEVIELLNASSWRSDPSQGLEPDSVTAGLALMFETVGTTPRPYTRFIVETDSGYVTVQVDSDAHVTPDASLEEIPGVGRLLTNTWETFVLTDDGTLLSLSRSWPNGGSIGVAADSGLEVTRSMAHVDQPTVVALANAASAREVSLPEVGRVTVGDKEIVLRGGTAELPEALCVVASGVEGCTLNHRFPNWLTMSSSSAPLPWTNEWLLAGDDWFFVTYVPNDKGTGVARVCPATTDGSLGQVLEYDETILSDRVWTLASIPDDSDFTMLCAWEDRSDPVAPYEIDHIPPNNIHYIVRRPSLNATTPSVIASIDQSAAVESLLIGVPVPAGFDVTTLGPTADSTDPNERYQLIVRVSGAVACSWLDAWFTATENGDVAAAEEAATALATSRDWPMLLEIQNQGGWTDQVWLWADAINGGPGILTGGGPLPPSRELAAGGLGCETP